MSSHTSGRSGSLFARFFPVGLFLLLSACATTDTDTFYRVQNPQKVDQAYIRAGTDFSKYRKLMADPLGVVFLKGANEPSEEDLNRIRASFRTAFKEAVGRDYEIVDFPAHDVLRVHADLVDLKITYDGTTEPRVGGRIKNLLTPGKLTFIMELRDSRTGTVLARAADTEKSADGEGVSDWDEVDIAAEHWAKTFREWLDENLRR